VAPAGIGVSCSSPLRAVGTGIPYSGTLCDEITEAPLLSQRKGESILFGPGSLLFRARHPMVSM